MPGGDGTGPMGMGPMTGRAAGYCAGYASPGSVNRGFGAFGLGRGFGRGGGRGRRNWFYATGVPGWARAAQAMPAWGTYPPPAAPVGGYAPPPAASKEQQLDALKTQAEYFEGVLSDLRGRIEQLSTET